MKEFWDERYKEQEYAYGIVPNAYLEKVLEPSRDKEVILMVAEGEGRNAVYAAQKGWSVKAFDQSIEARNKAFQLAKQHQVEIDYLVSDVESLSYELASVDAVALIYAHFPECVRRAYHRQLGSYVKAGGTLILEAFAKEHIYKQKENPNVGGPSNPMMLYSLEELKEDFCDFEFINIEEVDIELSEGLYHRGIAKVIRGIAKKK